MSENSKIEWTDHTFNPWIGCARVSPGCDNCYAAVSTPARVKGIKWGVGEARRRTADSTWKQPKAWNARHDAFFAEHGRRQRVFCASLADVFDNEVDNNLRNELLGLIYDTPNLDWLLLTKRIGNVPRLMEECTEPGKQWELPPNVWLGATIVNQEEANRDIPKLLAVPAATRFLSIEPLLGQVDLTRVYGIPHCAPFNALRPVGCVQHADGFCLGDCKWRFRGIDWVIVGGESGPGARPMHPDRARSLRDQCADADVPFLFKQHGEWVQTDAVAGGDLGGDMRRGTVRLVKRVGESDGHAHRGDVFMRRVGKRAAGRELDGVTHDGFPEANRC